jgi:hypothetical protein
LHGTHATSKVNQELPTNGSEISGNVNLAYKHAILKIIWSTLTQTQRYEFVNVDWSELAGEGIFWLSIVLAVRNNKEFPEEMDSNNRHVHDLVACS